ncbi:MAG: hypothetical protein JKX94_09430 [Sneathiella sp.]|nr:hypothetical protein [Sneathiella sp.]
MKQTANRLKSARIAAGYVTGREFADKNGVARSTYSTQESGTRGLTAEAAELYAEMLGITPSWLLFGKEHVVLSVDSDDEMDPADINLKTLNVIGAVEAGNWLKSPTWPYKNWKIEICPKDNRFPTANLFCLIVSGNDMDKRYQINDILRCLPIEQDPEGLIPGKRYIVHRTNAEGLIEVSAKELRLHEDGTFWLWPLSNNPKHQTPIEPSEDLVRIRARIVGHSSNE